jgi:hypothetical protein
VDRPVKSSRIEHVDIVDADGEYTAEFQAQFAAYVADLEAEVDHPTLGGECRELLAMDREDLRALFAVTTDLMNAGPAPWMVPFTAVLVAASLVAALLITWCVL